MASTGTTLYLDNGAHSIKAIATAFHINDEGEEPIVHHYRNAVVKSKLSKRNFVADELDNECYDYAGLVFRLAFDRGILNNWDVEKTVWDRVLSKDCLAIDPMSTSLMITEPPLNLPNVQDHHDQVLFESYDFARVLRVPGPALVGGAVTQRGQGECVLVVDSGFSFTHIVPVINGQVVASAVRRIDIGGKLLTNHLKELVSFRQWYMMDQTAVIERVKEECCYVSLEWDKDWERASTNSRDTSIVRTYVLPDFVPGGSTDKARTLGYVREGIKSSPSPEGDEVGEKSATTQLKSSSKGKGVARDAGGAAAREDDQLLQMANERFTTPELLFNPSIIGLQQAGIPETILDSISSLPEALQGMFWDHIVCVGGNAAFPGFRSRLDRELRSLAPANCSVSVTVSSRPIEDVVRAAPTATAGIPLEGWLTRQEYSEGGSNAARRKFGGGLYVSEHQLASEFG